MRNLAFRVERFAQHGVKLELWLVKLKIAKRNHELCAQSTCMALHGTDSSRLTSKDATIADLRARLNEAHKFIAFQKKQLANLGSQNSTKFKKSVRPKRRRAAKGSSEEASEEDMELFHRSVLPVIHRSFGRGMAALREVQSLVQQLHPV
jgi:hypothetical protein